jgi:hypothetical protein
MENARVEIPRLFFYLVGVDRHMAPDIAARANA